MLNCTIGTYSLLACVVLAHAIEAGATDQPVRRAEPRFLLEWGEKGAKPGQFYSPICIAISAKDEVFVADLNNSRIQQFTTEGKFKSEFDLPIDQKPRKSCMVGGLAVDREGVLYVSLMIQHKIAAYSKEGKLLREWGKKGTGDGEFNQPGGIVIRADGSLVIVDQCNHRIQVFNSEGKFLRKWGEHGIKPGQFGGLEPAGSRFAGPHFISQDSKGRLYTSEGVLGRIQQFDRDGTPTAVWGDKKKEPGAFGEYRFGKLKNTFGPIGVRGCREGRLSAHRRTCCGRKGIRDGRTRNKSRSCGFDPSGREDAGRGCVPVPIEMRRIRGEHAVSIYPSQKIQTGPFRGGAKARATDRGVARARARARVASFAARGGPGGKAELRLGTSRDDLFGNCSHGIARASSLTNRGTLFSTN